MESTMAPKKNSNWQKLVDACKGDWEKCPEKREMISEIGDERIAIVAYCTLASSWKEWMDYASDALHGRTPRECLKSVEGTEDVKAVLSRMHR